MPLILDALWRAMADALHPRVILLSLLPLVVVGAMAGGLGFLYWDAAVSRTREALDAWPVLTGLWNWIERLGATEVRAGLAPLALVFATTPLIVIGSLVIVAVFLSPALTRRVAARRFPALERKKGGSTLGGIVRSLGVTLLAVVALVVSMPLWLVPPLVLVLPPLIWGWLTYRVMSFDALAEHASVQERLDLMRRHRLPLLTIGILCGYLGAAPSIVWASGLLFAVAFPVLIPLAIWIYTLVFAFSALWFGHYLLAALSRLRVQAGDAAPPPVDASPATLL
ncbi:MAG: EI24 domain-containing protein [Comamonadaceae bacterium]|nr:MAG: EI24 domain-containing protein [Comamonadaceae bacterium]